MRIEQQHRDESSIHVRLVQSMLISIKIPHISYEIQQIWMSELLTNGMGFARVKTVILGGALHPGVNVFSICWVAR